MHFLDNRKHKQDLATQLGVAAAGEAQAGGYSDVRWSTASCYMADAVLHTST